MYTIHENLARIVRSKCTKRFLYISLVDVNEHEHFYCSRLRSSNIKLFKKNQGQQPD